ncbi:MAG TPA: hypothetical protein VGU25_11215 [Acidobacteriaceae bacterium]|nr:hypothetical protein [Acidobacteriaceae bacterium]
MMLPDTTPRALVKSVPKPVRRFAEAALDHIQSGCFQRSMALLVAGSSLVSTIEVGYEHYRGSYSNPVMYTPVTLGGALTIAATAGVFSERAANTWMRWLSYITLVDGVVGFCFHIRGVARKPGGWRMPVTNVVMGPPLFAPLLFGTSAYLGVIASYLQREEDYGMRSRVVAATTRLRKRDFRDDIRTGRFQKHLCLVAAVWTVCSGMESWYSHYKDNFKYKVQWSPILLTPLMLAATLGARRSKRLANTALPAVSALLMLDGTIGFGYHIRGILKRSGGKKKPLYNILYGPPIFAPLLVAACGLLGMMAYLMRRER